MAGKRCQHFEHLHTSECNVVAVISDRLESQSRKHCLFQISYVKRRNNEDFERFITYLALSRYSCAAATHVVDTCLRQSGRRSRRRRHTAAAGSSTCRCPRTVAHKAWWWVPLWSWWVSSCWWVPSWWYVPLCWRMVQL